MAIVNLTGVFKVELYPFELSRLDYDLGDYRDGRYAWRLENIRRLAHPVPARGQLSLWDWDREYRP